MKLSRSFLYTFALWIAAAMLAPATAEAGPLLDWLRRGCGCKAGCATPPAMAAAPAAYAGMPVAAAAPCGLQPGQCQVTCNQTCSRTVVNYVPYTAYRTSWEQVPVTQYKPVTNSDPCTGCTVTCMKPCTSYVWQAKQVPYTTYRACYRTENYTTPVTYVTNDCATGNCATGNCGTGACPTGNCGQMAPVAATTGGVMAPTAGCSTCSVPGTVAGSYPSATSGNLDGTYYAGTATYNPPANTYGSFPTTTTTMPSAAMPNSAVPTPADSVPAIQGVNPQSMQRPVIEQLQATPAGSSYYPPANSPPANLQTSTSTAVPSSGDAREVARQAWSYSPVRLASYEQPSIESKAVAPVSAEQQVIKGQWHLKPKGNSASELNSAWSSVNW